MEGIDVSFTVLDQEELEPRLCDSDKVPCLGKSQFVGD
jgi:hypothetical protein